MNIKRNLLLAIAPLLSVFAFSTVVTVAQTEPARTEYSLYGMHLIEAGRTARLAVVNPRFSDSEIVPCVRVRMVFDIYEASSSSQLLMQQQRLRFVRRVSREVLLDGGEAVTWDLTPSRGEYVSPAVFVRCEEACPSDPTKVRVSPTLSVLQGERTILNIPAVLKGFDPQPDPPR